MIQDLVGRHNLKMLHLKLKTFTSNAKLPNTAVSDIATNALNTQSEEDRDKATQDIIRRDTTFSPKMKAVVDNVPEGFLIRISWQI